MEFAVEATTLTPALKRAHGVTRKSTLAVLESVLVKASGEVLTVTAFDTEVAITTEVPARVRKPGTMLLSKGAFEYLSALRGELTFHKAGYAKPIHVECGASRASFSEVGSPEDFPSVPQTEVELGPLNNGGALLDMLQRVPHACSLDKSHEALAGVHLHPVEGGAKHAMVATDGKRLATLTRALGEVPLPNRGIVLPATAAVKMRQLLDEGPEGWSFGSTHGFALLRRPGLTLLCRLVEATFPDYTRVTSLERTTLPVPREGLLASLDRVALAGKEVALVLEESGRLRFEARNEANGNQGEDELQVRKQRLTPRSAWFHYTLLREALANATGEEVLISVPAKDNPLNTPAFISTTEEDGYLAAVMPLSQREWPAPQPEAAAG